MSKKKQKVVWDFKNISTSGNITLDKPSEVRFFFNLQADPLKPMKVNGVFLLDGYNKFTLGGIAQPNPFELILVNDPNEVDVTQYVVGIEQGDRATMVVKYLIDEEDIKC